MGQVIGTAHRCDTPDSEYDKPRHWRPTLKVGDIWECGGCEKRYHLDSVYTSDHPNLPKKPTVSWFFDWSRYRGRVDNVRGGGDSVRVV